MIVYLIFLAGFLFALGGWGVDFAHRAIEDGTHRVGIPWPTGTIYVDAAFWFNLNFFALMLPAFPIALLGMSL